MRRTTRVGVLIGMVVGLAAGSAMAQVDGAAAATAPPRNNPYTPPPCVAGVPFADVTCSTFYDAWIEQFAADGITAGCGNGDYCPNENVTRAQMAVFIEAAMHGTGTWTPGDLGNFNTGVGANSLSFDTTGSGNTGLGNSSLNSNPTGSNNTGLGIFSLANSTSGNYNTGLGAYTLSSNTTGTSNTAVGTGADVASGDLDNATAIGAYAVVDASSHVRIGNTTVTQIGGQVAWSNLSDVRAKTNIRPLDLGLDFVMALRPVAFQLINGNGRTDLGFIAQDVEALLGDDYNVLGIGGDDARTLSLRYTDFIAPMVKAIQDQQATIRALQQHDEQQQATIKALAARLAAVEARLGATSR
jgi:hypothetical protein